MDLNAFTLRGSLASRSDLEKVGPYERIDITLKVRRNHANSRGHYEYDCIPVEVWNYDAVLISRSEIGTEIEIAGRIVSQDGGFRFICKNLHL